MSVPILWWPFCIPPWKHLVSWYFGCKIVWVKSSCWESCLSPIFQRRSSWIPKTCGGSVPGGWASWWHPACSSSPRCLTSSSPDKCPKRWRMISKPENTLPRLPPIKYVCQNTSVTDGLEESWVVCLRGSVSGVVFQGSTDDSIRWIGICAQSLNLDRR